MAVRLAGIKITMLGGDQRELVLVHALIEAGAEVYLVGYSECPGAARITTDADWRELITVADVVIAPMSNTDNEGKMKAVPEPDMEIQLDEETFAAFRPGVPLFIGKAKPVIRDMAARFRVPLVELAEEDELAILNSIPTAEGAIRFAMEELPITIHGSNCIVLGFGRCGITLARMLDALGAKTTVAARNKAQLARAYEMGFGTVLLSEFLDIAVNADVIFNTIPARIITAEMIEHLPVHLLVIDIASEPGGVDFKAAAACGIRAVLLPGLPGKVAPQTAGEILAKTVPAMIEKWERKGA